MARLRKNYILFRNDERESVMAGSFSSMKRAREAIKEDALKTTRRFNMRMDYVPNIELTPEGGRLRIEEGRHIDYYIKTMLEDTLEPLK